MTESKANLAVSCPTITREMPSMYSRTFTDPFPSECNVLRRPDTPTSASPIITLKEKNNKIIIVHEKIKNMKEKTRINPVILTKLNLRLKRNLVQIQVKMMINPRNIWYIDDGIKRRPIEPRTVLNKSRKARIRKRGNSLIVPMILCLIGERWPDCRTKQRVIAYISKQVSSARNMQVV